MQRFLLAGLGLAAVLSGCGGSGGNDRLIYGLARIPDNLDPVAIRDKEGSLVTAQIFEGLVEFIPNEVGVKNCLADRWEISTDGRTYSFALHENVRFHDGTWLDAAAVTSSLTRLLDSERPKTKLEAPTAGAFLDLIESVEALNPQTVRITLKEPYSPFLKDLARPCCAIVSPSAVKKHGKEFGHHPVGTGPYRSATAQGEDRVVLERWEDYWDIGGKVSRIEFLAVGAEPDRLTALTEGGFHITDVADPEAIQLAESQSLSSIRKTMGVSVVGLAMGCTQEPFSSLNVRQAIAHAVNKEHLVTTLLNGSAEVARSALTPPMWGYRERPPLFPYNPARARELLRQAGHPDGFRTRLTAPNAPDPALPRAGEVAEAIRKDLEAVGIHAEIEFLGKEEMEAASRQGLTGLSLRVLESLNGDADSFLAPFADSPAAENRFHNPVINHLLTLVRGTTEQDKRREYYAQLDEMVLQDVPWVFLWHPYRMTAVGKDVVTFSPHPTGLHRLREVTLR